MIGVVAKSAERPIVKEFFELFKTPWEFFDEEQRYDVLIVTGEVTPDHHARLVIYQPEVTGNCHAIVNFGGESIPVYCSANAAPELRKESRGTQTVIRLGHNLWTETEYLLRVGQPVSQAQVPTLDLHISWLRSSMLAAGVDVIEIPPVPAGFDFSVALTHDIDFVGIRRHKFDHTLAGFLYRSTWGALRDWKCGKLSTAKLFRISKAVASLPGVYAGLVKDFWSPFEWYLAVEKDLPATYYFIPFKGVSGDKVRARNAQYRASCYDIADVANWTNTLRQNGCEVGVHGIDAWHCPERGRAELDRVRAVSGSSSGGIRMHWLLQDEQTPRVLEQAGYDYDSTVGYNDTVGYRAGTGQVYLPLGNRSLLELPMHIQDGALFFPDRLAASEAEAWELCQRLIVCAQRLGGVMTLLWHDRSHGPERFWGEFYARLVGHLRQMKVWFGSAEQVVRWFRHRRQVRFQRSAAGIEVLGNTLKGEQPMVLKVHHASRQHIGQDTVWDGSRRLVVNTLMPRRIAKDLMPVKV